MQLFLDVYAATKPPLSSMALECLTRMASVRRSLFTTEVERNKFLARLMGGTRDILRLQQVHSLPRTLSHCVIAAHARNRNYCSEASIPMDTSLQWFLPREPSSDRANPNPDPSPTRYSPPRILARLTGGTRDTLRLRAGACACAETTRRAWGCAGAERARQLPRVLQAAGAAQDQLPTVRAGERG
jgi:hypothetical protein